MMAAVVLDHEDGVALVAQGLEDVDQPARVAGMEADRRLVEHVQRAHEPRAQGGGERDALRLARRRACANGAIQGQVVEAHVRQVARAAASSSNRTLAATVRSVSSKASPARNATASRTESAQIPSMPRPPTCTRQRFGPQAAALAGRADLVSAIAAQEHADLDLVLLRLQPAEEADDALELVVALQDQAAVVFGAGPSTARPGRCRGAARTAELGRAVL